jgi:hypothetical protein
MATRSSSSQQCIKAGLQPLTAGKVEVALKFAPDERRGDAPPPPPACYTVRRVLPVTPAAHHNWHGAAEHWQESLANVQRTAALLQGKCAAELQRQAECAPLLAAGGGGEDPFSNTLAARRAVNASLATQMEFFTACKQAWTGAPTAPLP